MKKFHKRAAVFLTAATLAGLPAGAFFYSSPGSLTVWADNVEVESSEESSPEDVDFSDESEAEILADPVEQAQEDAGNDVTETPEVGITFTEPEGWQTDTATVKIQVEDTKNTGAFSIAKVEARLSENGGWSDITGNMEVSISSNCIKTEISCHGELFTASGKNVLQYGWKEVEERFFKSYGKNAEKPEEEESDFPDIKIGQVFECVVVKFSEHFTALPKHYTEDTLLSAMEHAGSSDTIEDAERKGLGTPATRAAIIEKLIEKGFIERKKKQILPTADGRNLIRILPEMIKSPKLTAEWENDLTLISKGQKNAEEFLYGIEKMVTKLVSDNGEPVEEYQKLFSDDRKEIGKCPRCGNKVYVGNRNYYCSGSDCNFTLWKNNRFFESQGKTLDEATVRKLLSEKQVHFKDLVSEKTKRKYEATIKMEVSETGNPKFQLIFPERKKGKKNEE